MHSNASQNELLLPEGFSKFDEHSKYIGFTTELFDSNVETWQLPFRAVYSEKRSPAINKMLTFLKSRLCTRTGDPYFQIDPEKKRSLPIMVHLMVFLKRSAGRYRIVALRLDEEYHPEVCGAYLSAEPGIQSQIVAEIIQGNAIQLETVPNRIFLEATNLCGPRQYV